MATKTPVNRFPSIKINFDEPEDWNIWSRMLEVQYCAFG